MFNERFVSNGKLHRLPIISIVLAASMVFAVISMSGCSSNENSTTSNEAVSESSQAASHDSKSKSSESIEKSAASAIMDGAKEGIETAVQQVEELQGGTEAATTDDAATEPEQPAAQEPAYSEPAYSEPAYSEPAYSEPAQPSSSAASSGGNQSAHNASRSAQPPTERAQVWVSEWVTVVDQEAWDEPVYSSTDVVVCNGCGGEFGSVDAWIAHSKELKGSHMSYHVDTRSTQTGTIHHDAVTHQEDHGHYEYL